MQHLIATGPSEIQGQAAKLDGVKPELRKVAASAFLISTEDFCKQRGYLP